MADSSTPPLPPGWTAHKAPTGHTYYYNKETKKSTYTRPAAQVPVAPLPPAPPAAPAAPAQSHAVPPTLGYIPPYTAPYHALQDNHTAPHNAYDPKDPPVVDPQQRIQDLIFGSAPNQAYQNIRGGNRGGFRGGRNASDRQPRQQDRPKHRTDIPNCAPWVLVRTKLGRRFVWNKNTNESFWKFPPHVMKAVVEFDRREREKKERRERGEPSDIEDEAMADIEAELAEAEEDVEIIEVDGEEGMENEEEYEEVEITDDEGEGADKPPKRQRTEEAPLDQPGDDDDMAWQLAQMEEMDMGGEDEEYDSAGFDGAENEDQGLSEGDCKALFRELLDDLRISPYTPWDKVLENDAIYEDYRYTALRSMKERKDCFDEWARERMQQLREEKACQQKRDPRIAYLAFLDKHATPKLYWPEFRRKFKKEPEIKDAKLADKEKEKLYREHIKRLALRHSDLKSDLSALLRAQSLATLNRSTTTNTLPDAVLTDLRYISLPPSSRDALVDAYITTLPSAPEGAAASAEEEAEAAKKRAERERREKALAQRERRVQAEKQRQERDLAYSKERLREEEAEIERAMQVGKEGLKAHLNES